MKLTGQFPPATHSENVLGWFGLLIVIAFLLPWVAIAGGCVIVGVGSLWRGDYSLVICLPAGLALFLLPTLLIYLNHRWYRRISSFTLEGGRMTYQLSGVEDVESREVDDVCWIRHVMSKSGKTRGYRVKFQDGRGIFVCRSLTHADEFAQVLKESVKGRSQVRADH